MIMGTARDIYDVLSDSQYSFAFFHLPPLACSSSSTPMGSLLSCHVSLGLPLPDTFVRRRGVLTPVALGDRNPLFSKIFFTLPA